MEKKLSPKAARRHLRDIHDHTKHFHTKDQRKLKNLLELYHFLKACDDETFRHHVDGSKNDFANWVRHVIMDEELARQMERCLVRKAMLFRILRRINQLVSASTRPLSEKEKALMILESAVAPEEMFVAKDGRVLHNLWELHNFLQSADHETFRHHVNERKNDIAEWVGDSVGDVELSESIRRVVDKDGMGIIVGLRILILQKKSGNLAPQPSPFEEPYVLKVVKAVNPQVQVQQL